MNPCETIQELLSAYLDGELTQQQRQRVRVHLDSCEACRRLFDDLERNRAAVHNLPFPEPDDEQWSRVMGGLIFKTTRGTGWLLWIGGAAVLTGYGLYEFIRDPSIQAVERVGVLAIILGVVLVFLTVLLERLSSYRTDKYKDVEK